jgi:succinate dehydrogenase / fumarate reductase cytochrome b subunit
MKKQRPLSPHLQVYRLPLAAVLSISHRISGVVLSLAVMLLVVMLALLAFEPFLFDTIRGFFDTTVGNIAFGGFVLAFWYHFCSGLRHLLWDFGYGYDLKTVKITNILIILWTIILTSGTMCRFIYG